jgi:hypothetical protein
MLIAGLLLAGLLAACAGWAGSASPAVEPDLDEVTAENNPMAEASPVTPPDFSDTFAEMNQLYDRLEANTPIEVAPANASVQTVVLMMPTLF